MSNPDYLEIAMTIAFVIAMTETIEAVTSKHE